MSDCFQNADMAGRKGRRKIVNLSDGIPRDLVSRCRNQLLQRHLRRTQGSFALGHFQRPAASRLRLLAAKVLDLLRLAGPGTRLAG